jgi:hypothetical protein
MNRIKNKFKKSFRWNIFGSLFYESTKVLNQILLLKVMSPNSYGLMAATFSFIYFVMYLSELGGTQALPAFLKIFTKNKQNLKKYFIKFYLLPQIAIYSISMIIAFYYYKNSFLNTQNKFLLLIIPVTILFEGTRSLLRRFLHNVFETKRTVTLETITMSLFLILIWLPYIITKQEISLLYIFSVFLATSITGVIFFILITIDYCKKIPEKTDNPPQKIISRIIRARFFSYTTNVGKNFFSGNFLTPFFAATFGLQEAGLFNIANHLAESVKAITKSIIMFSGGGVFAQLKTSTIKVKKLAFKLISTNLNNIIFPVLIFITINNKFLFRINDNSAPISTTSMTLLFFIITSMELFFMAYEQFYVVEEKVEKLFLFKLFEMLMFYIVISSKILTNPILVLLSLLIIKILSFIILAVNAYTNWKLKPIFKVNTYLTGISFFISIAFKLFCLK